MKESNYKIIVSKYTEWSNKQIQLQLTCNLIEMPLKEYGFSKAPALVVVIVISPLWANVPV